MDGGLAAGTDGERREDLDERTYPDIDPPYPSVTHSWLSLTHFSGVLCLDSAAVLLAFLPFMAL